RLFFAVLLGLSLSLAGAPSDLHSLSSAAVPRIVDLDPLNTAVNSAWDINNAGQIVGSMPAPSGGDHAFLWENGVMTDLGTLGGASSNAYALNNNGQIVGYSHPNPGGYNVHA